MRLFFMICLIFILSNPLFAFERGQPSILSEDWIGRPSPVKPTTEEENLAVLAASEHRDITMQKVAAKYDGMIGRYETITVTTLDESDPEIQVTSRYRILNNLICEYTRHTYSQRITAEKIKEKELAERLAYQLAVNANGRDSEKPLISGNKMLAVTFNGKCDATVIEKNFDHEVVAKYDFKLCD